MKLRQGLPALVLAFAVVVAAVVGLVVRPATAESLVYTYALEPGQTRTYAMTTRMVFTPQGIPDFTETMDETVTGKMTMKVVEVRKDGSTLIDLAVSEVKVTGSGVSSADEDGSIRMRISKSGEVLDIEGSGAFGGFDFGEFLGLADAGSNTTVGPMNVLPAYPSEAIGPGDMWTETADVPLPFGDAKMHMTARGEHQGFQDTNYGRAARMHMKMSMPFDFGFSFADILAETGEELPSELDAVRMVMGGSLLGDMTALVSPDTGDLVKMQMDMKMNFSMRMENAPAELTQGAPSNFRMLGDMRMKLDRIA